MLHTFTVTIACFLIALASFTATGTVRYVKAGNPTPQPPYLTWATASDSIQKCITLCSPGDTIYLGNGTYREQVVMIPRLTIIGSGWDSCVVDVYGVNQIRPEYFAAVILRDSCTINNFKINVLFDGSSQIQEGVMSILGYNATLQNIYVYRPNACFDISSGLVENCFSYSPRFCITSLDNLSLPTTLTIRNNVFTNVESFCYQSMNFRANVISTTINNNVFILYDQGTVIFDPDFGNNGTYYLVNNIFAANLVTPFSASFSIYSRCYFINNLFYLPKDVMWSHSGPNTFRNNVIAGVKTVFGGISGVPDFKYNALWKVTPNSFMDSTNKTLYPQVLDDIFSPYSRTVDYDFHLEKYSLLIDAGDPGILDKDGTRSDIGAYGGPGGESYIYRDGPPRMPTGLTALQDTVTRLAMLSWERNYETDFSGYTVYADTIRGFPPDSLHAIARVTDTFYVLPPAYRGKTVYCRVSSKDRQNNNSSASAELRITLTGTGEAAPTAAGSAPCTVANVYPNPFRGEATIGYSLKEPGYVKIAVYTMQGELISWLKNGEEEPGSYRVTFTPPEGGKTLASNIYVCKIDIISAVTHTPVYSAMQKMVYIK